MSYVELITGNTIEGMHRSSNNQTNNLFDPLKPLSEQPNDRNIDPEFFMTNPSIPHYGNINFFKDPSGLAPEKEDYL